MSDKHRIAKLEQALKDIVAPIAAMRRNLPEGAKLNGGAAVSLSNDANYLREIARKALEGSKP